MTARRFRPRHAAETDSQPSQSPSLDARPGPRKPIRLISLLRNTLPRTTGRACRQPASRPRFAPIRSPRPLLPPAAQATIRRRRTLPETATLASRREGEGTGQPGSPQLEGAQTPQLTIHKSAPREIQVGKPAVFRVTVRNTGLTAAAQVEIHDRVPRGTRLLGTSPAGETRPNGELVWTLGTIRSGEEAFVEMQVMPHDRGRNRQRGDGPFRRRRLGPHRGHSPAVGRGDLGPQPGARSANK